MENSELSPFLIRVHPGDNVAILGQTLEKGQPYLIAGIQYTQPATLQLGHKIALCRIGAGDKVLKYGAPIGSATHDIERGEHVHLHNMRSDYLPTFTLDKGNLYAARH